MLYMKEMRAKVVAECTLKESAAINQILGRRVSIHTHFFFSLVTVIYLVKINGRRLDRCRTTVHDRFRLVPDNLVDNSDFRSVRGGREIF